VQESGCLKKSTPEACVPMRIQSIAFLLTSAVLISIVSSAAQGQSPRGLSTPPTLLETLDQEDRDCVVQAGGPGKSVTVQPIQLAADHTRQLLVKGSGLCLCGAQNCKFWIYRKAGSKYQLLLTGTGATKVRTGKGSAKGYRDVISESHASAAETILRTYRFDGSKYQPQQCVNRAYYDDNGKYTKKPTYRPC
jgi:hypothetical protein